MGTLLKMYNMQGGEIGTAEISAALADEKAHSQMIKDYIVALRANVRRWSANTKTRSEMNHSTNKPHPQKGQGRSRQGSLVAPQYRGGGRVFGPKPKPDFHIRKNRKERCMAIRALLAEKIRNGHLIVVDSFEMEAPKTKIVTTLLKKCGFRRRVLMLGEGEFMEIPGKHRDQRISIGSYKHECVKKSAKNIPLVEFSLLKNVDGYSVAVADDVIITQSALAELEAWKVGRREVEGGEKVNG